MAFKLFEISNFLGRPVSLYEFTWGPTVWRYTSADSDVEHGEDEDGNPIVWTATAISDNGFTQGPSAGEDFEVALPRNLPVVQLFVGTPPSTEITLTVRRYHKGDPDAQAIVYWTGTVTNVGGEDAAKGRLVGIPISGRTRRTGLRKCWEHGCNSALYDADCRVDKESFKVETVIDALTGASVTVASLGAFPGAHFAGGFIEWEASAEGALDRRAIESFSGGTTVNLLGTTDRLTVGQAVTLYLGCDLTPQTCRDRFDNIANFGGFDFMAGKSPFDGDFSF